MNLKSFLLCSDRENKLTNFLFFLFLFVLSFFGRLYVIKINMQEYSQFLNESITFHFTAGCAVWRK